MTGSRCLRKPLGGGALIEATPRHREGDADGDREGDEDEQPTPWLPFGRPSRGRGDATQRRVVVGRG